MKTPIDLDALTVPLPKTKVTDPVLVMGQPESPAMPASPAVPAQQAVTGQPIMGKQTFRMPQETIDRARAAYITELNVTRTKGSSFSSWVTAAIEAAIIRVEEEYNQNRPLQDVGAGIIPKGPWGQRPDTRNETSA